MTVWEEKKKRKKKKKKTAENNAAHSYTNADNRYSWSEGDTFKYNLQQEPSYSVKYNEENSCVVNDSDQTLKSATYEPNVIIHKVAPGEGIWGIVRTWFPYMNDVAIAQKVNEITMDNRLKSQTLSAGQELKINMTVNELVKILNWMELNGSDSDLKDLKTLQTKLPQGYKEAQDIRAISNKQGQDVRTVYPENITETEFKKLFFNEHHQYWHLITHGVGINNEDVLFKPYIAMAEMFENYQGDKTASDGALVTDEIKKLPLQGALLVFINACETAINKSPHAQANTGGPDTVGRSVIEAGAQQSISTYWRVDDTNAKVFAESFYNCLFKDPSHVDASAALREVQIAMMKSKTSGEHGNQVNNYTTKDWAAYQYLSKDYTKEKYGIAGKTEEETKTLQNSLGKTEAVVELIKNSDKAYTANILSAVLKTSFQMPEGKFDFAQAGNLFRNYVKFNMSIESDPDRYTELYNVLWGEIDCELSALQISKVYLSTSGVYDEINLDALYDVLSKQYVIEKYHLIKLY